MKKYDYGHLEEIKVHRDDQQLYTFKEGDFKRLRLQDIKDMLILLVQQKLTNLTIDERYDLNVALRMFTRRIVIQRWVEDLQLGVKSYKKKLNLTKPDTFRSNLKNKTAYTSHSDPHGIMYVDQFKSKRLMCTDELHKFNDGMLNDVWTALHDIANRRDLPRDIPLDSVEVLSNHNEDGNPVKEILLKLNLPNHKLILTDSKMEVKVPDFSDEVLKLKNFKKDAIFKLFNSTSQERYKHVSLNVTSAQDGKDYKKAKREYAWLMITFMSNQRYKSKPKVNDHYTIFIRKRKGKEVYEHKNEDLHSLLAENEKLKAQLKGKMQCVTMPAIKPKVLSLGVNSSTLASGSKPPSNTKNNKILPAKSDNQKKVEAHLWNNKSNLKQENRVDFSISYKRTHYKELYDSIKIMHAKHIEQVTALITKNVNLKSQILNTINSVSKDHVKPKVLAPGKYAIDVEPIVPRLRNNREAHLDYLRHLKESVETIREIVKEAKVVRPLDSSNVSAFRYTKHSQKLLEYAIGTCPQDSHQQDKKHAPAPLIRKKQVTFAEQCDKSNSNTHKHVAKLNTQKTNVPVPPSTGVNRCTDASKSQPRSNTKKIGSCQLKVVQIVLWYLDSGYSKHIMRDRSRLMNFVKKFIGTARFRNDHFGAIIGYADYVIGDSVISRTISVEDMMKSSPSCLLSKSSKNKLWLWHHRLNHLNFSTINELARKDQVRGLPRLKFEKDHLCSACLIGKRKKYTHKSKSKNTIMEVLHTLHMDLCGPITPSVERLVPPSPVIQVSVVSADTPSSTTIDQDASSTSHSLSSSEVQPPISHQVKPKNFKTAMAKAYWSEAMQEESYKFDQLQVSSIDYLPSWYEGFVLFL
nr:integrase, catalytic region, zinc finger, CCHC-type, peptidase aspartic, catalytic [Tanacetum cinerariifolium]